MGLRKFKPTTPGQRNKIIGRHDGMTATKPEKSLVVGKKSTGGRKHQGKMTIRLYWWWTQKTLPVCRFQENERWSSCGCEKYRI